MAGHPTNSEETSRLLEMVRQGQIEAREALLARHREAVRRFVACRLDRRVSARVDASDVVQEVLLAAAKHLPDYGPEESMSFRLWLRLAAIDRIIQLHRFHLEAARRSVHREVPLADHSALLLAGELTDAGIGPDVALERQETIEMVRRAIDRLSEEDREVLVLRQYEGLNNAEAAAVLGLSPAAASKRFGRALRRLHARIRGNGLGESDGTERSPTT